MRSNLARDYHAQEAAGQTAMISLEELAPVAPGVAVSLEDRSRHLLATLNLVGQANKLGGLVTATEEDSRHRSQFEQRYDGGVERLRNHSGRRREQLENDASWQFAYATGHFSLIHSGLLDPEAAKAASREDFREFRTRYFGSQNADKHRAAFRAVLQASLEPRAK